MTVHECCVGMELRRLRIEPISRTTLALFAGASGDHQPSHLDIEAAKAKGRDDVIAHGMLMMAYLGRSLIEWAPQEKIRSYKARFVAATPVHAEPTCSGRVVAINDRLATLELAITLADGTTVLRGEAVVEIG
ncbi:bifunctional enoyl-CoA hydratase/phosphate acetyltransferase [Caballeronia calidae]|uniref:Bifunctional enoyl-CoA hydratase/phosphate acetyltransferase n=1 Tax=Caballeronia calidae TaxID=1777139 RepID=A0A158A849_9BURK|nr:MaoC/PaaZ C-terminal domain-containing protein [Caballeronia calidae]SAK53963.1 bifunctional enoyl-CoA hydratase/phosphate acetyltransferase [Caballeronia calidae]